MDRKKFDITGAAAPLADTEESAREGVKDQSLDLEKRSFNEIRAADLDNPNLILPTMIRIMDKMPEKFGGLNAIGYLSDYKDFRVLNIFRDKLDAYRLKFWPDNGSALYYVDPGDFDRYIALDDYFSYLRAARVEELQGIVEALGASRYQITYMFQKPSFGSVKEESGFKLLNRLFEKKAAEVEIRRGFEDEDIDYMEIVAGTEGEARDPEEPEVRYLKKDPSVQTLISQRMDENAPEPQSKYILKLIDTCGIKAGTAAKIDAAMKDMKFSGNTTVTAESQNEGRRFLKLEIEF